MLALRINFEYQGNIAEKKDLRSTQKLWRQVKTKSILGVTLIFRSNFYVLKYS